MQFTTPHPIRLEVRVAAGDIDVTTIDGEESTVSLDGASRVVESMRVELIGERLVIEPQRRPITGWFGRHDEALHIDARVPHGSRVEIATASGHARLDGRFRGVESKSASGDLVLSGELDGDARAKSVSGDVRLPRVAGDVTVQTVSGDVSAEAVDGSVAVKSVSGDVRVGSLREGKVTVRSVSGDVELGIAAGTSVDVDAGSASGELSSEVPLSAQPGHASGPVVVIRSQTVSGDLRVVRAA